MIDILVGGYELVRLHPGTAVVVVAAAYGITAWILLWARRKQSKRRLQEAHDDKGTRD